MTEAKLCNDTHAYRTVSILDSKIILNVECGGVQNDENTEVARAA